MHLVSAEAKRKRKDEMGVRKNNPEMEVTEIIKTKVSRLCPLLSHSRGFLSRLWIFKSIYIYIFIYSTMA